jgi:hypothetical protein
VQPTVSTADQCPPKRRRRNRWLWISLTTFLLLLIAGFVYAAWPGRSTFTVGPEATYVTGPLDKDGYVDYVTALNERLRGNIKPEDNANVLLWQALGPRPSGKTQTEEYFRWLGAPPPPDDGEYFVWYKDYLVDLKKKGELDSEKHEELIERWNKAAAWPWRTQDEPELAEWLRQMEKPLAFAIAATRRPDYYNPLVPQPHNGDSRGMVAFSLLPSAQACRGIGHALACRAMLRLKEGKTTEAWQDLLACHRLGRLVARGGDLLELLAGISIDGIAQNDVTFLYHSKLTPDEIRRCWRDLEQLPPIPMVAEKLDLASRFGFLDTVMYFASEWPADDDSANSVSSRRRKDFWHNLFTRNVDFEPAMRNANRWYDRCVANARVSDRAARKKEWDAMEAELKALTPQMDMKLAARSFFMGPKQRGEVIGNILIGMLLPSSGKLVTATERSEQSQRLRHIAFALALYHADHGHYPEKLAELTPKYVDKVPDDLFSGKPLIYKLAGAGYLLYSVGDNGIDDGGRWYDDDPKGDDLAVRMPVPEPKVKK